MAANSNLALILGHPIDVRGICIYQNFVKVLLRGKRGNLNVDYIILYRNIDIRYSRSMHRIIIKRKERKFELI